MSQISVHLWALGALAFFMGGIVKGTTGMGLPVVVVAILAAALPVADFLPLMAVPTIATNVWMVWQARRACGPLLKRLLPVILAMLLATWLAAGFMASADPRLLRGLVGLSILLFVALSLSPWRPHIGRRAEPWAGLAIGAAAGAIGAVSGNFSPVLAMFLLAVRMDKDAFVAGIIVLTFAASVFVSLAYTAHGLLTLPEWGLSALAFLPAIVGVGLGNRIRREVSPDWFRRIVLALLAVLAVTHVRAYFLG